MSRDETPNFLGFAFLKRPIPRGLHDIVLALWTFEIWWYLWIFADGSSLALYGFMIFAI